MFFLLFCDFFVFDIWVFFNSFFCFIIRCFVLFFFCGFILGYGNFIGLRELKICLVIGLIGGVGGMMLFFVYFELWVILMLGLIFWLSVMFIGFKL